MVILSFCIGEPDWGGPYSMWGLTIDLNKLRNISSSMQVKVLKMMPRFLFEIFTLELYDHERLNFDLC